MTTSSLVRLIAVNLAIALSLTACGDDANSESAAESTTTAAVEEVAPTLAEWVAEFDRLCVETANALTPELTEAEFAEVSSQAIVEMRAIGLPAEKTDEAEAMLEAIEETTTDPNLTDDQIAAYDQQFLAAATRLGISDDCIGGAPG
jgi:hypothetical protein